VVEVVHAPAPIIRSVGINRAVGPVHADTSKQLAHLGLPHSLLPADMSHGLHCALVDAMSALPVPPPLPSGKGSVLAVIGERNAALAIARDVAESIEIDPEDVVVCGPRRRGRSAHTWLELSSAADAAEHRRSWRWRMHPTVV